MRVANDTEKRQSSIWSPGKKPERNDPCWDPHQTNLPSIESYIFHYKGSNLEWLESNILENYLRTMIIYIPLLVVFEVICCSSMILACHSDFYFSKWIVSTGYWRLRGSNGFLKNWACSTTGLVDHSQNSLFQCIEWYRLIDPLLADLTDQYSWHLHQIWFQRRVS